jgi:hypothetical protein
VIENRWPRIQGDGDRRAITGFQRVTVLGPRGSVRRLPLICSPVEAVCVEHDGPVIVAGDNQISRLI